MDDQLTDYVSLPEDQKEKANSTMNCKRNKAVILSRYKQLSLFKNKGAVLILIWNFLVFGYQFTVMRVFFGDYNKFKKNHNYWFTTFLLLIFQSAIQKMLFPVAGWIADVHLGRYRVIHYSMLLMWIASLILLVNRILEQLLSQEYSLYIDIMLVVVLLVNTVSLAGFHANIIPFGIDQLTNESAEHFKSFIRWYYWTRNLGVSLLGLLSLMICYFWSSDSTLIIVTAITVAAFLSIALCIDFLFNHHLKHFKCKENPFYLVRKVLIYTMKHSYPRQRSALTYNPSYNPKRIDYSMNIYGGPFQCNQVEDVKTFVKMLKVLLVIGTYSLVQVLVHSSTTYFLERINTTELGSTCFTSSSTYWQFNPLIISLSIPLYEFIIYPVFEKYTPRTLRRIGGGMAVSIVTLVILSVLDFVGTSRNNNGFEDVCEITNAAGFTKTLNINVWLALIPVTLGTLGEMLGNISAFEFVIAQSPYNLRGFMIGILYAVQGIFALVAVLLVVPFTNTSEKHINCPPGYYSLLIVLSVSLFIVYLIITRRYQRRERGPIVNERQMIETNFEHMFDLRDTYHKEQNE